MIIDLNAQNEPTFEYRNGTIYAARFDLTYTDEDGRKQRLQRRENAKFHTRGKQLTEKQLKNALAVAVAERRRELADELLRAKAGLLASNSDKPSPEWTVRRYFDWIDKNVFLVSEDLHVLERSHYKRRMAERYFLSEFGERTVNGIDADTMRSWWAWFRQTKWSRPVLSPKTGELIREGAPRLLKLQTAKNIAMIVSSYFTVIAQNGHIVHPLKFELVTKGELATYKQNVEKSKLYLTSDQYSTYREMIREDDCYIALLINAELGLRIAEACEIDLVNCDTERRIITVKASARRVKGHGFVQKSTKSANGQRKLPMSDELCAVVEMRRREILESGQLQTKLAMVNGKRINPDHAIDRCADILTKILGYRPSGTNLTHGLRRTTNSRLAAYLTADIRAKALGHTEEVNASTYTQEELAQIELIRKASERALWQSAGQAM